MPWQLLVSRTYEISHNVLGLLVATPIISPADNATDYFNRKKFHFIVLQAMVDHEYCFMNVYAGWPGSV